jgi:hypothetical protein
VLLSRKSSGCPMPDKERCLTRGADEGRLASVWIYANR